MTKALTAAIVLIAAASLPGQWASGPPLPVARSEVAVTTLGDDIYVIGGYANGNVDQSLVQTFRPIARCGHAPGISTVISCAKVVGTWRGAAPLPRGLNHVGAVGYHGKVYAFGGFAAQNDSAVSDANVYDPKANLWSAIAPLPRALGSVSVAVLGDEIHLVGGRDVHSVGAHLVYDPATNRYSTRAPLPVGRDHMGLVAFKGRLYAIGGRIDTPAHNVGNVDIYDPHADAWTSGAPLPTPRSGMAIALYRDKIVTTDQSGRSWVSYPARIFAIGGEESGMASAFTTDEAYDPSTNHWSEYAPLPEGRHGTGAAVVHDFEESLYVPAGASVPGGSHQTDTLLIYRVW